MAKPCLTAQSVGPQRVVKALQEHGEMTQAELCAKAFVTYSSFKGRYRDLLIEAGLIHISGYEHTHGAMSPIYKAGPAPKRKAGKPKPLDQLAKAREWKAKTNWHAKRSAAAKGERTPVDYLNRFMGLVA